jgi:hypothetical protein
MTRDEIAENYPELLVLNPEYFDKAILGVVNRINTVAVCYSESKIIEILMKEDGMDYDEAIEYYQYNILGSWVGEHTPVYLEAL